MPTFRRLRFTATRLFCNPLTVYRFLLTAATFNFILSHSWETSEIPKYIHYFLIRKRERFAHVFVRTRHFVVRAQEKSVAGKTTTASRCAEQRRLPASTPRPSLRLPRLPPSRCLLEQVSGAHARQGRKTSLNA